MGVARRGIFHIWNSECFMFETRSVLCLNSECFMSETRSVSCLKLGVFHVWNSECFIFAIRNTQYVLYFYAKCLFYAKAWLWNIYRMLCSRGNSSSQSSLNRLINWLFFYLLRSNISSFVSILIFHSPLSAIYSVHLKVACANRYLIDALDSAK